HHVFASRTVWDQKVAGSNPAAPTNFPKNPAHLVQVVSESRVRKPCLNTDRLEKRAVAATDKVHNANSLQLACKGGDHDHSDHLRSGFRPDPARACCQS